MKHYSTQIVFFRMCGRRKKEIEFISVSFSFSFCFF